MNIPKRAPASAAGHVSAVQHDGDQVNSREGWHSAARDRLSMKLKKLLALATGVLVAVGISATTVSAATPTYDAIPSTFCDGWYHHGGGFEITCPPASDLEHQVGSMTASWRTYTWCPDVNNKPPCDSMIGSNIMDGGIASLAVTHAAGSDPRSITATVVATSDPKGMFGPLGKVSSLQMLPGNMLQMNGVFYCGSHTDLSQYPESPCGA
jgi:hypothetical protein